MKEILCQEIRDSLRFNLKLVKKNRIWLFDKHYIGLSKKEFGEVLSSIAPIYNPIRDKYGEEVFDCEDFAHVLSAFVKLEALLKKYKYGIAFGEITTRQLDNRKIIHTLNYLITDNLEAYYFEPQAGIFLDEGEKLYEPFYARI